MKIIHHRQHKPGRRKFTPHEPNTEEPEEGAEYTRNAEIAKYSNGT